MSGSAQPEDGNWPSWARGTRKWLGILAGLVVAVVAVLTAYVDLKKIWCDVFSCAVAPQPVVSAAPKLEPYSSGWVDGGHTQEEMCGPRRNAYSQQYPDYDITMNVSEDRDKDWKGHATYKYNCFYAAVPRRK